MTEVLDWQSPSQQRVVLRRAVRALVEGQLVAFPTETVYGVAASALVPAAVERLREGKNRPAGKPLTLAIRTASQANDWIPEMSPLGRRLARRCWPGPVTLVFKTGAEQGLAGRLQEEIRQHVCPGGTLGLRIPAHEAVLQALELLPGPMVLSSANQSGVPAATSVDEVLHALGDEVALVINDGPCRYGQASTVVGIEANSWEILREGVLPAAEIERQASCLIVFVCTGNTCRSPMAEALCKRLLADRLGCSVVELPRRGFLVHSAGLAAMMGGAAAAHAVEAVAELGGDLSGHQSRPLLPKLAAQADFLVAMTQGHLAALTAQFPHLTVRPRLLSPNGHDLPDPIGSDGPVYRDCARQIRQDLAGLVSEILH
jgi:protein-tyrosine phosphatase